ncbi:MAG: hypothetical protein KDJ74_05915 [Notoacmeibacter sp.]|nr:hypothetical protein [Notoacmeibacter sp.]
MNAQQSADSNIRQRMALQAAAASNALDAMKKPAVRFSYNAAGDCIATAVTSA